MPRTPAEDPLRASLALSAGAAGSPRSPGALQSALATFGAVALLAASPNGLGAQGPVPEGPEFQVNSYTTGDQSYGAVASNPSGGFVVVWFGQGEGGAGDDIYGQRYDPAGGPLGSEFLVNSTTPNDQEAPALSTDDAGNFVVAWQSYGDGNVRSILGQRFDALGSPLGGEFQISTFTAPFSSQVAPSISHDGGGNFVVVWTGAGQGVSADVFGRRFDPLGNALGAEFMVNTYSLGDQILGTVASDDAGNFVVVWANYGFPDTFGIFGQRFDSAGSPTGGEFQVDTYGQALRRNSAVAMTGDGRFVVVWQRAPLQNVGTAERSEQPPFDVIRGRRFDANGNPVGEEFQVNSSATGTEVPAVAIDDEGEFVVVWTDDYSDGDGPGVFGRRFDSSGDPLGGDFQVSSYTTSFQSTRVLGPPLAMDAAGDFVVTWTSIGQDGDGNGVFAQRFLASAPELFADGFESGDTSAWSLTVP